MPRGEIALLDEHVQLSQQRPPATRSLLILYAAMLSLVFVAAVIGIVIALRADATNRALVYAGAIAIDLGALGAVVLATTRRNRWIYVVREDARDLGALMGQAFALLDNVEQSNTREDLALLRLLHDRLTPEPIEEGDYALDDYVALHRTAAKLLSGAEPATGGERSWILGESGRLLASLGRMRLLRKERDLAIAGALDAASEVAAMRRGFAIVELRWAGRLEP